MEYTYAVTCQYDYEESPHWTKRYDDELEAWQSFFSFTDWGLANEYSTVNISTPTGKMYTKIFYREGRKVVTK
jgi:hypothetical protein